MGAVMGAGERADQDRRRVLVHGPANVRRSLPRPTCSRERAGPGRAGRGLGRVWRLARRREAFTLLWYGAGPDKVRVGPPGPLVVWDQTH